MDTSNFLLSSITSDLNDLTYTQYTSHFLQDFHYSHEHRILDHWIHWTRSTSWDIIMAGYLFIPFIGSIVLSLHSFTHWILGIPIYSWTLLWHADGRSILEMLQNLEGSKWILPYDKKDTHHCWQERARTVPCWARHKRCHHLQLLWSKNESDILTICGYHSRLCMFSFYQIHPTSINKMDGNSSSEDGVTAGTNATTNLTSFHWTSSFLSGATLLWRGHPKRPTNLIQLFLSSSLSLESLQF